MLDVTACSGSRCSTGEPDSRLSEHALAPAASVVFGNRERGPSTQFSLIFTSNDQLTGVDASTYTSPGLGERRANAITVLGPRAQNPAPRTRRRRAGRGIGPRHAGRDAPAPVRPRRMSCPEKPSVIRDRFGCAPLPTMLKSLTNSAMLRTWSIAAERSVRGVAGHAG